MNLKGTLTEQRIREELLASQRAMLQQNNYPKLSSALRERFPNLRTAFVLAWTPEQSEDIFELLVDGQLVVSAQIPKSDEAPIVSVQLVEEYARDVRGRPGRLTLAVARLGADFKMTRSQRRPFSDRSIIGY